MPLTAPVVPWLRRLWAWWKRVARAIGDFQARLLLSLLYVVLIAPFAVGAKALSDPLTLRRRSPSYWHPAPSAPGCLEEARRQF